MDQFDALLDVAEKLLGPSGCPWDQKQTFLSLQPYVLEEAHEVIEAVDADDNGKMIEELGDLLYTIIFYAKLGERAERFTMKEIVETIKEKLIRRHPHVFSDVKVENIDQVVKNWEAIKAEEKAKLTLKSAPGGLPPTLPVLVKAQKILKRIQRSGSPLPCKESSDPSASEEQIGEQLLSVILCAEQNGIDAESALRRALLRLEETFSTTEEKPSI
jgi:uncharacterized protein YabN with tetrapyrrole methylase and pyrophosphatase domain